MCGILGVIGEVNEGLLSDGVNAMAFRGPDAQAVKVILPNVAFGHVRLSIIDLSSNANQPFSYHDRVVITFNGEIYNYQSLRTELKKEHDFKTNSDTEVLCVGYLAWGIDGLLSRIDGMYAFCLFDKQRDKAFLVTDPFGKKPLYYYQDQGSFYFSSTIDALRKVAPDIGLNIDERALKEFMFKGFISGPQTIYKKVTKLEGGSLIVVDANTRKKTVKRHFEVPIENTTEERSEHELIEKFEDLILKAIEKRLVADVPVGAFLSGGIDSSLIVSMVSKVFDYKLNTFTVRFPVDKYNEADVAKEIAAHCQTDHYEFDFDQKAFYDFDHLLECFGQPFADNSMIPTFHVSRLGQQFNKVVLTGDGGDEAFLGYKHYYAIQWAEKMKRLIPPGFSAKHIPDFLPSSAHWLLAINKSRHGEYFYDLLGQKGLMKFDDLFKSNFDPSFAELSLFHKHKSYDWPKKARWVDYQYLLPNDFLVKIDVMTMANSLEARSPFLDRELVEFAMSIPSKKLMSSKRPKDLLRRLSQKYLPEKITSLPKRGFSFPIEDWFQKERKSVITEIESAFDHLEPFMHIDQLKAAMTNQFNERQYWTLFILAKWLNRKAV